MDKTIPSIPLGRRFFALITFLLVGYTTQAATIYSQGSGGWEDPSTWSGTISDGDEVIIQAGDIIYINSGNVYNSNPLNLSIRIDGVLEFVNGKLILDEDATVSISSGGYMESTGTGNGEKLKIGNDFVWTANDGRVNGPYQFTKSGGVTVLPVVAVYSLKASQTDEKTTTISWVNEIIDGTPSELVIQGSLDGKAFSDLEFILSNEFSGIQEAAINSYPHIYFRIGIIDDEGNRIYSAITSLNNGSEIQVQVFPNPVSGESFFLTGNDIIEVNLKKNTGILLHQFEKNYREDFNELFLPDNLPNGMYYLEVVRQSNAQSIPVIIQR